MVSYIIPCNLFQIEQLTSTTQSQPLILKSDVLTTIATRFDKNDEERLSSDGCSFVLPSELRKRIQNLTSESSSAYSTFSVYERSPFVWDKINTTVRLYFSGKRILSHSRTAKKRIIHASAPKSYRSGLSVHVFL